MKIDRLNFIRVNSDNYNVVVFQATAQALALCSLARPGAVMHSDAAKGFIHAAQIHGMKHMLCTAGHRATQRAEGLFAVLKRYQSKLQMRRWKHGQLMKCLLDHLHDYKMKATIELQRLIKLKGQWCDKVQEVWSAEHDQAGECVVTVCCVILWMIIQ